MALSAPIHTPTLFYNLYEAGILPPDVGQQLFPPKGSGLAKKLMLANYAFYQTRHLQGKTDKVFTPEQPRKTGIRSLNNARFDKNRYMVVNRISFLACKFADAPTEETIALAKYGSIHDIAGLENGELLFKANTKVIISQLPLSEFVTDGRDIVPMGTLFLENPFLLKPDEELEMELDLPSVPDKTVVKVVFGGSVTIAC